MLDRTIKPTPTGKIDFNLPQINSFTLSNSLRVYHVLKNTLPIVQINLIIPAGSIYNTENKFGLSSLTSMLIDEGAGNLSGLEISDKIEILGSILNISSSKEFTTISLLTLKENFKKSLEIFSLIIQSPNFNESDFNRESQRLRTHILQLNDDPSYLASTKFQRIIYNKTPYKYPSSGTSDTISELSNDNVKNFYKETYAPNGSFLVVVGDITNEEIANSLNNYLINWKDQGVRPLIKTSVKPAKKQIVLINKSDAAQSEIRVGHSSRGRKSEDFYSRTILNSILGGQFSSRINLNLREDKGFTYGAHSSYSYNNLGSLFSVSTSVKTENTTDAIKEILFELENIKTTIKDDEVNFSKSYLVRRYPSLFETYSQLATNISLIPIFNLNEEYFANYISKIEGVTKQKVTQAATKNLLEENLVIVVVGNEKIIGNDLTKFANSRGFSFSISS
jgi:zinc protease